MLGCVRGLFPISQASALRCPRLSACAAHQSKQFVSTQNDRRNALHTSVALFQEQPYQHDDLLEVRQPASHAVQIDHPEQRVPERNIILPIVCPGCGAPSQTVDAAAAGHYSEKHERPRDQRQKDEDAVFAEALQRGILDHLTVTDSSPANENPVKSTPVCDRCHQLHHHSTGRPILHPSMDSIRSIIEESPYVHNHVYHILDAADFPMSLISSLQSTLHLPQMRTRNRRSKSYRYTQGRVADISFIITRADLLAPTKEQVDRLMPYMQEVLREALGRKAKGIRLGNVRMVSSKRGWWTTTLKDEIWRRGGAGWMVGKVNVGKSALVEVAFPKGRSTSPLIDQHREDVIRQGHEHSNSTDALKKLAVSSTSEHSLHLTDSHEPSHPDVQPEQSFTSVEMAQAIGKEDGEDFMFDESDLSLLPPAQPEVPYPTMPLVSALPGTTASPIRLLFGKGKGELIDMPGIQRSTLDTYVKEDQRKDMVMKHRITPEQQVVKPGQSLLLGGLIRITPKTEDLVFLAYAFVPLALEPHVTSTEKAIAIQTGTHPETGEAYSGHVPSSAIGAAKTSMKSAGSFKLQHDVTKQRAGPVTDKAAGKQKAENLPFIVYSMDLLIEGVGWVEIVAQTRRQRRDVFGRLLSAQRRDDSLADEEVYPEIEVFSPEGKHIGSRKPMNAWLLGGPKKTPVHKRRPRPRQTISFHKRKEGGRIGSQRRQMMEGNP